MRRVRDTPKERKKIWNNPRFETKQDGLHSDFLILWMDSNNECEKQQILPETQAIQTLLFYFQLSINIRNIIKQLFVYSKIQFLLTNLRNPSWNHAFLAGMCSRSATEHKYAPLHYGKSWIFCTGKRQCPRMKVFFISLQPC